MASEIIVVHGSSAHSSRHVGLVARVAIVTVTRPSFDVVDAVNRSIVRTGNNAELAHFVTDAGWKSGEELCPGATLVAGSAYRKGGSRSNEAMSGE